jgi:hypothetical protein
MTTIVAIKGFEYTSSSNLGEVDFWTCPDGKIAKVILNSVSHGLNASTNTGYYGISAVWVDEGDDGDTAHRTYLSALTKPSGHRTVQAGMENPMGFSGTGNTQPFSGGISGWMPNIFNGWQGSVFSTQTSTTNAWMPEIIMTAGEVIKGQAYYQNGTQWLSIRGLAYLEDIN